MDERNVEGYLFISDEDAKMARDEQARVKYISDKIEEGNDRTTLLVYNKSIESDIFVTPVGMNFLKELQKKLLKSNQITPDEVRNIPLRFSYGDAIEINKNKRYKALDEKGRKDYRGPFITSVFFNIAMVVVIILMFFITLFSKNENILNYKNAITNQYSEWDEELTQREKVIREKEKELNIN